MSRSQRALEGRGTDSRGGSDITIIYPRYSVLGTMAGIGYGLRATISSRLKPVGCRREPEQILALVPEVTSDAAP